MSNYHISLKTGKALVCKATTPEDCPLNEEAIHGESKEAARNAYEQHMSKETLPSLVKENPPTPEYNINITEKDVESYLQSKTTHNTTNLDKAYENMNFMLESRYELYGQLPTKTTTEIKTVLNNCQTKLTVNNILNKLDIPPKGRYIVTQLIKKHNLDNPAFNKELLTIRMFKQDLDYITGQGDS